MKILVSVSAGAIYKKSKTVQVLKNKNSPQPVKGFQARRKYHGVWNHGVSPYLI